MAVDRRTTVAFSVVILGILMVVAGFVCLFVALTNVEADWAALIIAGSCVIGIGFISALLAALYLTLKSDSIYSSNGDDSYKKSKPHLGAVSVLKGAEPAKGVPPLSSASKDHIYSMTLNLGSVDVRSEPKKSVCEPSDYEEVVENQEAPRYESPSSLQPGIAEGTKQFKD